jgi:hypothetical protein
VTDRSYPVPMLLIVKLLQPLNQCRVSPGKRNSSNRNENKQDELLGTGNCKTYSDICILGKAFWQGS